MIDLYTWSTPNGRKISIMLEECGLAYTVRPIDISKNDQFKKDFVSINPNSKIPAIVDRDGPNSAPFALFESGAILIYLAEKAGRFLPAEPTARYQALQWLMFQLSGVGPSFGQAHHFMRAAKEHIPYGIDRYGNEVIRLYGVMNGRLGEAAFLAGGTYTVADIATFPWVARHEWHRVDLTEYPNVARWFGEIGARAAVVKGMSIPADFRS
jgi:GST-like protein